MFGQTHFQCSRLVTWYRYFNSKKSTVSVSLYIAHLRQVPEGQGIKAKGKTKASGLRGQNQGRGHDLICSVVVLKVEKSLRCKAYCTSYCPTNS